MLPNIAATSPWATLHAVRSLQCCSQSPGSAPPELVDGICEAFADLLQRLVLLRDQPDGLEEDGLFEKGDVDTIPRELRRILVQHLPRTVGTPAARHSLKGLCTARAHMACVHWGLAADWPPLHYCLAQVENCCAVVTRVHELEGDARRQSEAAAALEWQDMMEAWHRGTVMLHWDGMWAAIRMQEQEYEQRLHLQQQQLLLQGLLLHELEALQEEAQQRQVLSGREDLEREGLMQTAALGMKGLGLQMEEAAQRRALEALAELAMETAEGRYEQQRIEQLVFACLEMQGREGRVRVELGLDARLQRHAIGEGMGQELLQCDEALGRVVVGQAEEASRTALALDVEHVQARLSVQLQEECGFALLVFHRDMDAGRLKVQDSEVHARLLQVAVWSESGMRVHIDLLETLAWRCLQTELSEERLRCSVDVDECNEHMLLAVLELEGQGRMQRMEAESQHWGWCMAIVACANEETCARQSHVAEEAHVGELLNVARAEDFSRTQTCIEQVQEWASMSDLYGLVVEGSRMERLEAVERALVCDTEEASRTALALDVEHVQARLSVQLQEECEFALLVFHRDMDAGRLKVQDSEVHARLLQVAVWSESGMRVHIDLLETLAWRCLQTELSEERLRCSVDVDECNEHMLLAVLELEGQGRMQRMEAESQHWGWCMAIVACANEETCARQRHVAEEAHVGELLNVARAEDFSRTQTCIEQVQEWASMWDLYGLAVEGSRMERLEAVERALVDTEWDSGQRRFRVQHKEAWSRMLLAAQAREGIGRGVTVRQEMEHRTLLEVIWAEACGRGMVVVQAVSLLLELQAEFSRSQSDLSHAEARQQLQREMAMAVEALAAEQQAHRRGLALHLVEGQARFAVAARQQQVWQQLAVQAAELQARQRCTILHSEVRQLFCQNFEGRGAIESQRALGLKALQLQQDAAWLSDVTRHEQERGWTELLLHEERARLGLRDLLRRFEQVASAWHEGAVRIAHEQETERLALAIDAAEILFALELRRDLDVVWVQQQCGLRELQCRTGVCVAESQEHARLQLQWEASQAVCTVAKEASTAGASILLQVQQYTECTKLRRHEQQLRQGIFHASLEAASSLRQGALLAAAAEQRRDCADAEAQSRAALCVLFDEMQSREALLREEHIERGRARRALESTARECCALQDRAAIVAVEASVRVDLHAAFAFEWAALGVAEQEAAIRTLIVSHEGVARQLLGLECVERTARESVGGLCRAGWEELAVGCLAEAAGVMQRRLLLEAQGLLQVLWLELTEVSCSAGLRAAEAEGGEALGLWGSVLQAVARVAFAEAGAWARVRLEAECGAQRAALAVQTRAVLEGLSVQQQQHVARQRLQREQTGGCLAVLEAGELSLRSAVARQEHSAFSVAAVGLRHLRGALSVVAEEADAVADLRAARAALDAACAAQAATHALLHGFETTRRALVQEQRARWKDLLGAAAKDFGEAHEQMVRSLESGYLDEPLAAGLAAGLGLRISTGRPHKKMLSAFQRGPSVAQSFMRAAAPGPAPGGRRLGPHPTGARKSSKAKPAKAGSTGAGGSQARGAGYQSRRPPGLPPIRRPSTLLSVSPAHSPAPALRSPVAVARALTLMRRPSGEGAASPHSLRSMTLRSNATRRPSLGVPLSPLSLARSPTLPPGPVRKASLGSPMLPPLAGTINSTATRRPSHGAALPDLQRSAFMSPMRPPGPFSISELHASAVPQSVSFATAPDGLAVESFFEDPAPPTLQDPATSPKSNELLSATAQAQPKPHRDDSKKRLRSALRPYLTPLSPVARGRYKGLMSLTALPGSPAKQQWRKLYKLQQQRTKRPMPKAS